jgi:hypothetical protein
MTLGVGSIPAPPSTTTTSETPTSQTNLSPLFHDLYSRDFFFGFLARFILLLLLT